MPREKGCIKYGGRQKGTPNKVGKSVKDRLRNFLDENFDTAVKEWKAIEDPKDKVKLYSDLLPYIIPKLSSVQMDAQITQDSVEKDLEDLSEEGD